MVGTEYLAATDKPFFFKHFHNCNSIIAENKINDSVKIGTMHLENSYYTWLEHQTPISQVMLIIYQIRVFSFQTWISCLSGLKWWDSSKYGNVFEVTDQLIKNKSENQCYLASWKLMLFSYI